MPSTRSRSHRGSLDSLDDPSPVDSSSPSASRSHNFAGAQTFPDSLPPSPVESTSHPVQRSAFAHNAFDDNDNNNNTELSPKSAGAPSLGQMTVPESDDHSELGTHEVLDGECEGHDAASSRSVTASGMRPTVPAAGNMDDEALRRPSQIAPDAPNSQISPPPSYRYPSDISSGSEPLASPLGIPMPDRPAFHSANSSTALLGDISRGENNPTTPFSDPFRDASPRPNSLPATASPSKEEEGSPDSSRRPPQIQINSIPNTPESADLPSFTPQIIPHGTYAPYADTHSSPNSALPNRTPTGPATRKGSPSSAPPAPIAVHNPNNTSPSARTSALPTSRSKDTIAQRRTQRNRNSKNGKKHKDGKDGKEKTGGVQMNRKPFESTRLKGEIYKPWLEKKDPAQRWARYITVASIFIGFAVAGVLCWDGYNSVPNLGKICSILDDDFSSGLNTANWQHEVRLDGYGSGQFQWTTASENNSFVSDGILYLVPTLTADHLGPDAIANGYTLNLTADGTCTSTNVSQCVAVSNSSRLAVVNPVQSARLITKNTVSMRYGKVEVKAKFPTGDWLWPAISMLSVDETYGPWPRSGQIDLLQARGNNASYSNRGIDYAQSDLHWGPISDLDRLYLTWGYREQRRTYYNQKWHTYGLEWNDKYMWTYIDSKVSQVVSLRFNKDSFWERGRFPGTITNTTTGDVVKLTNPWITSENNVAPFDQPFYLILTLGVGGIDGWFPDGEGGKPWIDNSGTAMSDFWNAKDRWWNNWPADPKVRGFAIDSVKMWKTC